MARALVIEEESGTYTGRMHPHNGYYAGDFSVSRSAAVETALSASSRRLYVVPGFVAPSVTPTGGRPSARSSDRPRAA
jgi:hypothetical protein